MTWLNKNDRNQIIGVLHVDTQVAVIAGMFNVSRQTMESEITKLQLNQKKIDSIEWEVGK